MSILSLKMDFPGYSGVTPRVGKLFSNDPIATVTSAGYINNYVRGNNIPIFKTDAMTVAASDNTVNCKVVLTGTSIQLVIQ